MTDTPQTPSKAWVIYEDIFGRQIGPYVFTKDFTDEQEAEDYKQKCPNSYRVARLPFKVHKENYPEYYNEI